MTMQFTDDHEAELWRGVYTSFALRLAMEHEECTPSEIAHDAGWHADAAVFEYRKRCAFSEDDFADAHCQNCDVIVASDQAYAAVVDLNEKSSGAMRCPDCGSLEMELCVR